MGEIMKKNKKQQHKLLKSKNFWVIVIYLLFLVIDHFALDDKSGRIWDNLKNRGLTLKKFIKL